MNSLDSSQNEFIKKPSFEDIKNVLQSSTKNVPPLTALEHDNPKEFWDYQIETKQVLSINNRKLDKNIDQVVDKIFDVIRIFPQGLIIYALTTSFSFFVPST